MKYFVTAIGTDSGKTLVSAILCEALGYDYWKPVQAGYPRDTETVRSLVSNPSVTFHPEGIILNTPASPHYAAEVDGIVLSRQDFKPPAADDLIIEGAGGMLVPINDHDVVIDLAEDFQAEIVLVSDLYLGSINHTLLTVEELKRRKLKVKGIIFNKGPVPASEEIIMKKSGLKKIYHVPEAKTVDRDFVRECATELKRIWA